MTRTRSRKTLYVILAIYIAYIFIPLLAASEYSFKTSVKGSYSLDTYRAIFQESEFFYYLIRSSWLSSLTVIVLLFMQLPLQVWLHIYPSHWKRLVEVISLFPLIVPVVAFAIGAQVAMPLFVQDSVFELPFLYAMLALPYTYRAIELGLDAIPLKTLYEAARITGGDLRSTILKIVIPNIKGSILASAALGFALCIGEFTLTSLLHWDTFPTWINDVSQDSILEAITLSVISLVIPILLIAGFAFTFTRERKTA